MNKHKKWRESQKGKGLCVGCAKGKPQPGLVLCPECLLARRNFALTCYKNGLCVTCAKPNRNGKLRCDFCGNKYRFKNLKANGVSSKECEKATRSLIVFGGICQCCGERIKKGKEKLDHNHQTKRFRGIICHGCNVAIGFASENTSRFRSIIKYLRRHK